MLQREWGGESNGSYRTYSSLVKLQPRFLSLQWKSCLLGRIAALVPEFAVKDLPLGRTLMRIYCIYLYVYVCVCYIYLSICLTIHLQYISVCRCFFYLSVYLLFVYICWSKTLMEQIFNPCGQFRWSSEVPVSQLRVAPPGIFSDLLRSVQMLIREWDAESNGKLPHYLSL